MANMAVMSQSWRRLSCRYVAYWGVSLS